VIATDWSGHLDFLSLKEDINPPGKIKGGKTKGKITTMKKKFAAVKYELKQIPQQAVWNGVLQADSQWAYIIDEDARKKMRDVFENEEKYSAMSDELRGTYQGEQYWFDKFIEELGLQSEQDENEVVL